MERYFLISILHFLDISLKDYARECYYLDIFFAFNDFFQNIVHFKFITLLYVLQIHFLSQALW